MKITRENIVNFLAETLYFPFIKLVYKPDGEPLTEKILEEYPVESLGYQTLQFIRTRGLKLMPGYELHDIKHCLLNIETNLQGEILMQYFEWGNGNRSATVAIVILLGPMIMPEKLHTFIKAFKTGKKAGNMEAYNLMKHLQHPTAEIKKQLNIQPI